MLPGLLTQTLSPREKILVLSADLDWGQCYCLVFLGMRLAVHAVRKGENEIFRIGLLPLIAGLAGIDWRDQLMMPGVYVICANRLGVDFSSEFSVIVEGLGDLHLDQSVEDCLTQDFSSTHYKDYGEGDEYLIY